MERTYKTIKWVLKGHIKNNVNSLWIWESDNFTMIYENYDGNERIYTSNQLLRLLSESMEDDVLKFNSFYGFACSLYDYFSKYYRG